MKKYRFLTYFLILVILIVFVGYNSKTSNLFVKRTDISIPSDMQNYDIVLDFSQKYYPELEFIMRNSRKKYNFEDFTNFVQKSIQLSKNLDSPITEEMTSNWGKTFSEKLSVFEMNMISCFWAIVCSDFYGFGFKDKTSWNNWETEASIEDISKNTLSMWIWDSFGGKTNGDKWYEIPHLKHAIFFGWSIQNNSCDVMRKNVNHLRVRYGLNFEMIKDVNFFQGIAICSFWSNYLLLNVAGASRNSYPTIREIAISNWMYNASTREGDVKTGQYFRDILTLSYGEKDEIWYQLGLDKKAVSYRKNNDFLGASYGLFDNIKEVEIKKILSSLP